MKRVLVIGATGTIGREVVTQLLAAGAGVRALARRPDPAGKPAGVELTSDGARCELVARMPEPIVAMLLDAWGRRAVTQR